MPDERKVSPGTPLGRLPSMSANWLNAVSDMLNWYRREVASGQSTGSGNALQDSSGKVKVKNLTGSDLSRGHYVQLGDYVPTTVNHRFQWYQGNLYDVAEDGRVAVIVSPTKQNEFREARILGKCTARVNVTDTGHRFAEPDDGAYVLKSAASGNIEILSTNKISGTGEQELTVILGGSGGTAEVGCILKATAGIDGATDSGGDRTPTQSGDYEFIDGDSPGGADIYHWSTVAISEGSYMAVVKMGDNWTIVNAFC